MTKIAINKAFKEYERTKRLSYWLSIVGALITLSVMALSTCKLRKQDIEKSNAVRAQEHINTGIEYYTNQNYSDAIKEYDLALKYAPNSHYIYNIRGFSLLQNKQFEESVKSLEKSISINPKYSWGYYNLALAYWAVGNKDKISKAVENAILNNPNMKTLIKKTSQYKDIRNSGLIKHLLKE